MAKGQLSELALGRERSILRLGFGQQGFEVFSSSDAVVSQGRGEVVSGHSVSNPSDMSAVRPVHAGMEGYRMDHGLTCLGDMCLEGVHHV